MPLMRRINPGSPTRISVLVRSSATTLTPGLPLACAGRVLLVGRWPGLPARPAGRAPEREETRGARFFARANFRVRTANVISSAWTSSRTMISLTRSINSALPTRIRELVRSSGTTFNDFFPFCANWLLRPAGRRLCPGLVRAAVGRVLERSVTMGASLFAVAKFSFTTVKVTSSEGTSITRMICISRRILEAVSDNTSTLAGA